MTAKVIEQLLLKGSFSRQFPQLCHKVKKCEHLRKYGIDVPTTNRRETVFTSPEISMKHIDYKQK